MAQAAALATCLRLLATIQHVLTVAEEPSEHARALRVSIV
jgi:hypothetical protein